MTPQNTPLYAQDLGAWAKATTKPTYTATEVGAISTSAKGANNGVAELDANGKVPSSQLPSYVNDVLEYNSSSNFPATGETGKIYIDLSDNKTYRWSGSTYVVIGSSLALGTTSSTAFRGDYGDTAYQHASAKGSEFSSGFYKITTNAEGHVTAATAVAKEDITALGIPGTIKRGNAAVFVGTCSTAGSNPIKDVVCPAYDQLVVGDIIYVTFTYANEVSQSLLRLNVNNTGVKYIKRYGGTTNLDLSNYREISTGSPIKFIYDGTYWKVDSAGRIKITYTVDDYNTSYKSLLATNTSDTNMEASVEKLRYAYYYRGRLYSGGYKVFTEADFNPSVFLSALTTEQTRHDQYLYNLESSEYRIVLRIFLVTPNGHILKKNQASEDYDFLGSKNYRVNVKAYDSSNNVTTVYHELQIKWEPANYYSWYNIDDSGIFPTPYWLELTTKFSISSDMDHIAVTFTNLDQDLYMYNPNQDLTFNITSLSHNSVEIKNVGLVHINGLNEYNGGYDITGYNLPDETVNVPQVWASDLESAELIRGYAYAIKDDGVYDGAIYWISLDPNEGMAISITDKVIIHDGQLFYTTGYFEIPLGSSGDSVQSNQGVANAGKFLVVNSSGIVEPVSMTAWQGGSY